tara:strand:+ start:8636 stop:8800 length:165 start_codon:yes stop_codon:yes gene_type:complete
MPGDPNPAFFWKSRYHPHEHFRKNPNIELFTKDRELVVKEVKSWKMKSIYKPAE